MSEVSLPRQYDLEDRTLRFAQEVISFVGGLPRTVPNVEVIRQVVRSSGSVGANWIEANEALSRKDFAMRAKICRKEAKETTYWLKLLEVKIDGAEERRQALIDEATELMRIFGSIVRKTE